MLIQVFILFFVYSLLISHANTTEVDKRTNYDDYCVELFRNYENGGDKLTICGIYVGWWLGNKKYKFNDVVSSIKLKCKKPCVVELFANAHFKGDKQIYDSNFAYWTNLRCEMQDRVSSVRVLPLNNYQPQTKTNVITHFYNNDVQLIQQGDTRYEDYCVELRADWDLGGQGRIVCNYAKDLKKLDNFDNVVSSLKLKCRRYCQVYLHDLPNFKGDAIMYYSFSTDWTNVNCSFNNRASSVSFAML